MGANFNFKSDYKLTVTMDKLAYNQGEIINGTIAFDFRSDPSKKKNLKITKPIATISMIQIEEIQDRSIPYKKENTIVCQDFNMPQLLNIKNNPDLPVPFQFQVPSNAQPNFEWPHDQYINCSLRSILKIEIKECKAIGQSVIIIRKNPTPLNSPLEIVSKTHKKGIFTGGDVVLKASYHTNTFPIFCKVPFTFTVDFTQSKYKIKGINYVLRRKIVFSDGIGHQIDEFNEDLMEKNIKGNMTKLQTENCSVDLKDPDSIHSKYSMLKLGMAKGLTTGQIMSLMPTFMGTQFCCTYSIKLKAITDTPLISALNSPTLELPIDVFSPLEYNMNNISINADMFPTMDQINSQQQQLPPQQQYGGQMPPQQPYGQIPPQSQPQYPPQQQFPPQQQYPQQIPATKFNTEKNGTSNEPPSPSTPSANNNQYPTF